jgi:hypothetical protein
MLTDAVLQELQGRGVTDESITCEDQRHRARDRKACAQHLADCHEHHHVKLQSSRYMVFSNPSKLYS